MPRFLDTPAPRKGKSFYDLPPVNQMACYVLLHNGELAGKIVLCRPTRNKWECSIHIYSGPFGCLPLTTGKAVQFGSENEAVYDAMQKIVAKEDHEKLRPILSSYVSFFTAAGYTVEHVFG